jgi:hypothetical protein
MHSETPSDQLQAKRRVALLAVERLLRVCGGHEPDEWLSHYKMLFDALKGERDGDAIKAAQVLSRLDSSAIPEWVASERLAEDVRKSIAHLRTHIVYGDQRPPPILEPDDPDLEAEGTRIQRRENELAKEGIYPGLPVIGLPVSELTSALSLIESTDQLIDKRVMSLRVQKDGSILVNTGEQISGLAGAGTNVVLKKTGGNWVVAHLRGWIS